MVVRLILLLLVGGVMILVALGAIKMSHHREMVQKELERDTLAAVRSIETMLWMSGDGIDLTDRSYIESLLRTLMEDNPEEQERVIAACFRVGSTGDVVTVGAWVEPDAGDARWYIEDKKISATPTVAHERASVRKIALSGPTYVEKKLVQSPSEHEVESETPANELVLVVDGHDVWMAVRYEALIELRIEMLLMAVMTLVGLILVRHWFAGPLLEVTGLTRRSSSPEQFYDLSRRLRGEFKQLAEAIGGMMTRIDATNQRLHQRDQAFADLYQFAPAALLTLDCTGKIIEANRQAVTMLGLGNENDLLVLEALSFIEAGDRSRLRQTIDRLDLEDSAGCELRVIGDKRTIDAAVRAAPVRDERGYLHRVRLSIVDISRSRQLQRQLAHKGRVLNLILDHMSDAILLVDREGLVAAHNAKLAAMLHAGNNALVSCPYDPDEFWTRLGILDHAMFVDRLRQIGADRFGSVQERFKTHAGTLLFRSVPVQDADGDAIGRLWVVKDVTVEEESQNLAREQENRLQALRRMNERLEGVDTVSELLERLAQLLYGVMNVDTLGITLRRGFDAHELDAHRRYDRGPTVLHRGTGPLLLDMNRALLGAVEKELMPQMLATRNAALWPDLPKTETWSESVRRAGLTSLAAVPLRGVGDAHGLLWVGRHGGERLDHHQINLMEGLAPFIADRLEIAQLRDRLRDLELTDPATDLPNQHQFNQMIRRLAKRPGHAWSVLNVNLDHFRRLNRAVDHATADVALREIGMMLQRLCRQSNMVTRVTGDPTFGVICPGLTLEDATQLGERLCRTIRDQEIALPGDYPWKPTVSIGVASCPVDGAHYDAERVVELAQVRTTLAKKRGRDCVVACGDGLGGLGVERPCEAV